MTLKPSFLSSLAMSRDNLIGLSLFLAILAHTSGAFGSGFGLVKYGVLSVLGLLLALDGVGVGRGAWYLGALGLSLWVGDPLVGFLGLYGEQENGLIGWLIGFLVMNGVSSRWKVERWLMWGGVGAAVMAWVQFFGLWRGEDYLALARTGSTMGTPIYLGVVLALSGVLAFKARRWVLFAVIASGLLLAKSRGGILGLLAGISFELWGWRRSLALGGAVLVGMLLLAPEKAVSDRGRFLVWEAGIKGFLDRPLLGWGPEGYYRIAQKHRTPEWDEVYNPRSVDHFGGVRSKVTQGNAHNLFLEVLCTTGFLGLLAFLFSFRGATPHPAAVAALVAGMFNPLSLTGKVCAMSLIGSGLVRSRDRRLWVALMLLGCLGWSYYGANDRLMRCSNLWLPWKVQHALELRFMVPRSA